MNAPQQVAVSPDTEIKMQDALKAQQASYLQEGYVSAETRIDRINRAIDVLVRHADRISDAIDKDRRDAHQFNDNETQELISNY